MSFKEISGQQNTGRYPIFLIPDVTGDHKSISDIAQDLKAIVGNAHGIYLWDDPNIYPSYQHISLDEYAAQLVQRMLPFIDEKRVCAVSGISYGCYVATRVVALLEAQNIEASLFLGDAIPFEFAQEYLNSNPAATDDLISIYNWAAQLASAAAHVKPAIQMSPIDLVALQNLNKQPFEKRMKILTEELLGTSLSLLGQNSHLQTTLMQYLGAVNQNLCRLLKYQPQSTLVKISSLGLAFTKETTLKHGTSIAECWRRYCHSLLAYPIYNGSHTDLFKKKNDKQTKDLPGSTFFANQMYLHFKQTIKLKKKLLSLAEICSYEEHAQLELHLSLSPAASTSSETDSNPSPDVSPFPSSWLRSPTSSPELGSSQAAKDSSMTSLDLSNSSSSSSSSSSMELEEAGTPPYKGSKKAGGLTRTPSGFWSIPGNGRRGGVTTRSRYQEKANFNQHRLLALPTPQLPGLSASLPESEETKFNTTKFNTKRGR